jgi:hypothetical protein
MEGRRSTRRAKALSPDAKGCQGVLALDAGNAVRDA